MGAVRRQPVPRLAPATRFRAPAVTLDAVQAGDVHIAAASVIGVSHAAAGGVRQDAYDFTTTGDGYLVIALADGLGSRPLSQLGAALFCTGVTQAAIGPGSPAPRAADELLCRGAEYAAAAQDFCQVPPAESAFVAAVAVLPPLGAGVPGRLTSPGSATCQPSPLIREVRWPSCSPATTGRSTFSANRCPGRRPSGRSALKSRPRC